MHRMVVVVALLCCLLAGGWAQTGEKSSSDKDIELRVDIGKPPEPNTDRVQFNTPLVVRSGLTLKDVVCIRCPVSIHGETGDVVAIAGAVEVNGRVKGDVVAVAGPIHLGPDADVSGDVVAVGGGIERDELARVGGEVTQAVGSSLGTGVGALLLMVFLGLLPLMLVLSVLCYLIAGERRVRTVALAARQHLGASLLAGLAAGVFAVALMVLFTQMRPLTPFLIIALCAGLLAAVVLGYTGISAWFGHAVRIASPLGAVLVGAIIISLVQAVPLVGALAFVVFGLMALGSVALTGFGLAPDWLLRRLGAPPPPSSLAAGGKQQ